MSPQTEPQRSAIDALAGPTLIEFGARDCGYCRATRPLVDAALQRHPDIRHIMIEDGKGRPLGRSFAVRLWPTLVLIAGGEEWGRLVRPSASEIAALLAIPQSRRRLRAAGLGDSVTVEKAAEQGLDTRLRAPDS